MKVVAHALLIGLATFPASALTLTGPAHVIDGATISIGDATIRLRGIDSFDADQTCRKPDEAHWPCGKLARMALTVLTKDQTLNCTDKGQDSVGRAVATCALAGGSDLGSMMVNLGYAIDWPESGGFYQYEQEIARTARRGVWAGTFDLPWDWRRQHGR